MQEKNKIIMSQFSDTILLPKTHFSMRANLSQTEKKWIEFWDEINLIEKVKEKKKEKRFILHDGPPYANGHLHLGHALNKILKDIICRAYKQMNYDVDYIPGWDCHGLPIEWKIEENYRKKGKNKDDIEIKKFRNECRQFAVKWINIQSNEFNRLGINCDWKKIYTTMDKKSESIIVSELLNFLEEKRLYLGHKPVMWSVVEKTALAEAEIEYQEKKSNSIFTKFPVKYSTEKKLIGSNVIIWTTTPWTLPGNKAIAFSKELNYQLVEIQKDYPMFNLCNGEKFLFCKTLLDKFLKKNNISSYSIIDEFNGNDFPTTKCSHPLLQFGYKENIPMIIGEHVNDQTGTGFVHIAPGHGIEDFELGNKFKLEIPITIENNGVFSGNVPFFKGTHIFKADEKIIDKLNQSKMLLYREDFKHSYPHSWRSKAPLIYRATSQWFISMEKKDLRNKALKAIEKVNWIPKISKNRISSMVKDRPDWCVSRQRSWGVPITVFINKSTGKPLIDKEVNRNIILKIEENGTDFWFSGNKKELLTSKYNPDDFEQVLDILDVWFDSGSSHAFVLKNRGIKEKADLYLEGSDQHRGWFQSSLIESCANYNDSPYKTVLTHGFVLDDKGKKMSKSLGNVISPQDVINKYGADILRLWVATSNYNEDLRISYESLDRQSEMYRKIRNSLRFILGNLSDWKNNELTSHKELPALEQYIRFELYRINEIVLESLKSYNFYKVFQLISNFCNNELSSLFFDIRKDCLYCEQKNSKNRMSCRTVLVDIFQCLISWLSPVLVFTTEEAWQCWKKDIMPEEIESCHLRTFKKLDENWNNKLIKQQWDKIKKIKKAVSTAVEKQRVQKTIKSSLEASPSIYFEDNVFRECIKGLNLEEILITSTVNVVSEKGEGFEDFESEGIYVKISPDKKVKCERCWKLFEPKENNGVICTRCSDVINEY